MKIPSKYNKYKLCYVDSSEYIGEDMTLYFTELKDVTKQWGDDWGDVPYEHNAGEPYEYNYRAKEQGVENGRGIYPKIDMYKVKLYGDTNITTPRTGKLNSPYSVEDINKGVVPWLTIKDYKTDKCAFIKAGTTLKDTLNIIKEHCSHIEFYGLVKDDRE